MSLKIILQYIFWVPKINTGLKHYTKTTGVGVLLSPFLFSKTYSHLSSHPNQTKPNRKFAQLQETEWWNQAI